MLLSPKHSSSDYYSVEVPQISTLLTAVTSENFKILLRDCRLFAKSCARFQIASLPGNVRACQL